MMPQGGRKFEFLDKFEAIWLGPYWIMKVYSNNTVQLTTLGWAYSSTCTNGKCHKIYHV